jgi:hypothetical protein
LNPGLQHAFSEQLQVTLERLSQTQPSIVCVT